MHASFGTAFWEETSAKFRVPHLDPERHLERLSKVQQVAQSWTVRRPVVRIEAPAGQGKSVFMAQLLAHTDGDAGWFQVGAEDRDPLRFVADLVLLLRTRLPGFRAPVLEERLVRGEIAADDLAEAAAALAAQLGAQLRRRFCLVFDDLHLLEDAPESRAFLKALIGAEVPELRFALLSRQPPSLSLAPAGQTVLVGSHLLSFSPREVAELLHRVFGENHPAHVVAALHRETEGWIMGILLWRADGLGSGGRRPGPAAGDNRTALSYFVDNVLPGLPDGLRRGLLRLSFLKTLPRELAQAVAGVEDAADMLQAMEGRNLFVRRTSDDRAEYVLHHLFQECLQQAAAEELGPEEIRQTLAKAGEWYVARGNPEEALRCFVRAGEHGKTEGLLREVAFHLLGQQRAATLKAILDDLPPAVVQGSPWLGFFTGTAHLGVASPDGVDLLRRSALAFEASGEEAGELLALASLLYHSVLLVADFEGARPLLERAKRLFTQVAERLPPAPRIHAAHMIATGEGFVTGDVASAERYSSLALGWADDCDLVNATAGIRVARLSAGILGGVPDRIGGETEHAHRLVRHPRVSLVYRSTLRGLLVNQLLVNGDVQNYLHHRARIVRLFGEEWLGGRLLGPLLRLWDIHLAVTQGHWAHAEALLAQGGDVLANWMATPHLGSMFHQYAAVLHAVAGRENEARAAAEASAALRRAAGGRFFQMQNDLLLGAAFAHLRDRCRAEGHLADCLAACEALDHRGMEAAARCHRAALRLEGSDPSDALPDLRALLRAIKVGTHPLSYGAWPTRLETALSAALKHGLDPGLCQRTAAELLGVALEAGDASSPLVQIRTLGPLEFHRADRPRLGAEELSDVQRRLLSILIGSRDLAATQSDIQLAMWPESSPERARASFNTTVSRLRKTLDQWLGGCSATDLLPLRNGVLRLVHCRVDALKFHHLAKVGLAHARRGEPWAAANSLRAAEGLWSGPFLQGLVLGERAEHFRHQTLLVYLDVAREFAQLLVEDGEWEEGLRVVDRALAEEPTDAGLVRTLHGLYLLRADPRRAQGAVDRYARALGAAGYAPSQVDAAVNSLWAPSA